MHYTARTVTASCAPWPLVVGQRTFTARPLSAALVLRLVPLMVRPETRGAAIDEALCGAFPRARWWQHDPLAAIASLTPIVQAQIIERLFATPGQLADDPLDPDAALIAAHRKLAHPEAVDRGPTLALAALTCEVRLGADWYYAPDRWPTTDGYAPLASVWAAYTGLSALVAQERLQLASAMQLANGHGSAVVREWRKLEAAAWPSDPTMRGVN